MMKPEYAKYLDELIEEHRMQHHVSQRAELTRAQLVRAQCNGFTSKFVGKFPHLKRVAGFYGAQKHANDATPGTEHWWLVDTDGTIVDPTAEQFRPGGAYTELRDDFHQIKIGRCMNCGWDIFGTKLQGPKSVCGEDCEIG